MVLSELIANAGLIDDGPTHVRVQDTTPIMLSGLAVVMGMARGHAVFHQPRVTIEHTVAEDIEVERQRVYSAFAKMREQIERMRSEEHTSELQSLMRISYAVFCLKKKKKTNKTEKHNIRGN